MCKLGLYADFIGLLVDFGWVKLAEKLRKTGALSRGFRQRLRVGSAGLWAGVESGCGRGEFSRGFPQGFGPVGCVVLCVALCAVESAAGASGFAPPCCDLFATLS